MKGIAILAWRDDVGAYIFACYPPEAKDNLDDHAMTLYSQHRFRSTEKNFKMIKRGDLNLASFYSGGYQSNYIGKPNYCVTLLLQKSENPVPYEKPLIKVTNNLLTQLDEDDFDYILMDIFDKLKDKRFDEIEIVRGSSSSEEAPATKKTLATTSSASYSDEEQIFADLMGSEDLSTEDSDLDSKMADFEKTSVSSPGGTDPFASDPFSKPAAADPFGGGGGSKSDSKDMFAENPFDAAQKPDFSKSLGLDEAVGKTMFKQVQSSAADIIQKLEKLDDIKPEKPEDLSDQQKKYEYLEELVDFLQQKVKALSNVAAKVTKMEEAQEQKDQLIGKLLLMLDEKS